MHVSADWVTAISTAVIAVIALGAAITVSAWWVSSVLFPRIGLSRVRPLVAVYRHILQFRTWNRTVESQHYREPLEGIASSLETIAKQMPRGCRTKGCSNLAFVLSGLCSRCIDRAAKEGTEGLSEGWPPDPAEPAGRPDTDTERSWTHDLPQGS